MRRLAPLALAALPLVLAACGGGGSSSSGGSSGATASACPKGAVVVHMRDIRFSPEKASAKVGQKVCWTNDDDVQHDVAADSGQFKSSLFGKGETFATTVKKAGSISYVCTVHPGMTGTLDVSS
jgi:plastocyanin